MTRITINALTITYPEGFHEMTDAEKAGLNFYKDGPGACLSDPDRHMIVTIGWMKSGIASLMFSEKEAARSAEGKISKPMAAYGYCLEGFSDMKLGGENASGFRYHYRSGETDMSAEMLVMKYKKVFYYLNFYARTGLLEESRKIWQEMLDSVELDA